MQKITIILTPQAAKSIRKIIDRCLHLASVSPNIADLLDISPADVERAESALRQLDEVSSSLF